MKTKFVPLALIIPAVVLAQPATTPSSQALVPPPSAMPAPATKPVNPAQAAAALSNAKQLSNRLKGGSLSMDESNCGPNSITSATYNSTGARNNTHCFRTT